MEHAHDPEHATNRNPPEACQELIIAVYAHRTHEASPMHLPIDIDKCRCYPNRLISSHLARAYDVLEVFIEFHLEIATSLGITDVSRNLGRLLGNNCPERE